MMFNPMMHHTLELNASTTDRDSVFSGEIRFSRMNTPRHDCDGWWGGLKHAKGVSDETLSE